MKIELIRENFIKFFEQKNHKYANPAPIVQKTDPSLMFTNAGMNQFKPYFTNPNSAPSKRLVNIQPCLRVSGKHNDIEDVGIDTYHHTMFEMMGTWSFGDYFKKEAITWAWELITEIYGIEKDRIYISTFGGDVQDGLEKDTEAYDLWTKYIEKDHILDNCTKKDNFWEMGDTGPCGPCTEIHVDIRSDADRKLIPGKSLVNADHPQVIEIWNLVFIQYERLANGNLIPLSAKHIDTGMGLERLAMVLQSKKSNYDTDIFEPLLQFVSKEYGKPYGNELKADIAMRVIVDHVRAVAFSIADGQSPSNNKAGYVIKRILRRAVRYGYTYLGFKNAFMYKLVEVLAQSMRNFHPHVFQQKDYIASVVKSEEEIFLRTLASGISRLEKIIIDVSESSKIIPGNQAFEMYDTYGFPIDLTLLIAKENGLTVDMEGFEKSLEEQKARSKDDAKIEYGDWVYLNNEQQNTIFVGYDTLEAEVKIIQYRTISRAEEINYQIVLDKTPFYAQGGGQVGDTGYLIFENERIAITDTRKENDTIVHETQILPKNLTNSFQAKVDIERRKNTENNHSATHLLHAALRTILGNHVEQRGSLVNDKILRFDFSHNGKIEEEDLHKIEILVNRKVRENISLEDLRNVPIAEAKDLGATALFGEKYGDKVRVVCFDKKYSIELCGGTHIRSTGQIGLFKILSCASIAAGIRRIEAVTAYAAENFVYEQLTDLNKIKQKLKNPKNIEQAVETTLQENNSLRKKISFYEDIIAEQTSQKLIVKIEEKNQIFGLISNVETASLEELKSIVSKLKSKYTDLYLILTSSIEDKTYIIIWLSKNLNTKFNLSAKTLISKLSEYIDGNGGGSDNLATAIGSKKEGINNVLQEGSKIWKESI